VSNAISEDLIDKFAPADVRDTVRWLKDDRFVMAGSDTDRGTFGSRWVFVREATEVHVTVDRSQWLLDIVPYRGGHPIQYDLLVAAQRGQDYRDCFPEPGDEYPAGLPSQFAARSELAPYPSAGADLARLRGLQRHDGRARPRPEVRADVA
jgi:hypothetical protein